MNSSFKLALTVTTFAVIAGSVSAKTGTGIAPAQILSIHLYDHAQAPAPVLHAATDETNWLFRTTRIRISWECPSTESAEDQGTDMTSPAFEKPDTRPYIVVRLMRRMPASVLPDALGYSLPFARTGAHVLIFYDRVETLAHSVNQATYIVLGHAMAHEIGHVLLGSSEHASSGLMQARWAPATWRLASAGLLAFRREEAERIGAGLQRIQARRQLPAQQPTSAFSGMVTTTTTARAEPPLALQSVPQLNIVVYSRPEVPLWMLQSAEKEAEWMLRPVSVRFNWIECASRAAPASCASLQPRSDLIVRLLPKALGQASMTALGIAGSSGGFDTAFIFYDRVLALRTQTRLVPLILGRVLAHEIAHLLLPREAHAKYGLMRGEWSTDDLRITSTACIGLSATAMQFIRQEVQRRNDAAHSDRSGAETRRIRDEILRMKSLSVNNASRR